MKADILRMRQPSCQLEKVLTGFCLKCANLIWDRVKLTKRFLNKPWFLLVTLTKLAVLAPQGVNVITMASIYDIPQNELIEKTAEELKKIKEIEPPVWANFVKTGAAKERPPVMKDWWYMRAAAILRKINMQGPIGVSKLRTYFGSKKNRGMKPERFYKGSGNIIRKVLQQLEKAGLAKQEEKGIHKGRAIAPKGRSMLDKISSQIQKSIPKKVVKKEGLKPTPKAEPHVAAPAKAAVEAPKAEEKKPAEPKPKEAAPKKEEPKKGEETEQKNE